MPIITVDTESVVVVCAKCKQMRTISTDSLVLGAGTNPNLIVLPLCPCGATECLIRTWGSYNSATENGCSHRVAVNSLATHLKSKSFIHPDSLAAVSAETSNPLVSGVLPLTVEMTQELAARLHG